MRVWTAITFCLISCSAQAQWAVYDEKVYKELQKINNIRKLDTDHTDLTKIYKANLNTDTSSPQDLTIGDGDNKAVLKGIDTKFEELTDLTPQEQAKYIGTAADCGSKTASPQVYNACLGLRNLRIQTLKTTQQTLRNLYDRRKQMVALIDGSRGLSGEEIASGKMQRYHLDL